MKYAEEIILAIFAIVLIVGVILFFAYGYSVLHNRECIDGILKQKHSGSNGVYYVNVIDDHNTVQCEVK